jgi:FKBP-type peptidyl-prolyl cis-trans isomerase
MMNTFLKTTCLLALSFCLSQTAEAKKTPKVKPNDTVTTASGLRYVITQRNPTGELASKGNRVTAHYTGTLVNGKKFDSSKDRNQPFSFVLGVGQVIKGWDEGFSVLRKGEKATLIIPSTLGYGEQDMGDIPPHSTLIFEVEMLEILKPMQYIPFSGFGKDTVTTPSGLKYIVIDKGIDSVQAKAGQNAAVYYTGYFTNGDKFDGNFDQFEPIVLPVVGAGVIKGWQEMLPLMHLGMKVRVIIPGYLAYGERGYPGVIEPNATLIFDMFLSDLL